jgi:hypothetical protein
MDGLEWADGLSMTVVQRRGDGTVSVVFVVIVWVGDWCRMGGMAIYVAVNDAKWLGVVFS